MPPLDPALYLTAEELSELRELEARLPVLKSRHSDLCGKMQKARPFGGLSDEEKLELRAVNAEFVTKHDRHRELVDKNPLLAKNQLP